MSHGISAIVAHFARQQDRLRRNIRVLESDDSWAETVVKLLKPRCASLIFFKRSGCASCNYMMPKVHELSNDMEFRHGSHLCFLEVDVDVCPRTAKYFKIDFTPAFRVLAHGHGSGEDCSASFSGISSQIFRAEAARKLEKIAMLCPHCTVDLKDSFSSINAKILEAVCYGKFSDGSSLRRGGRKGVVPDGPPGGGLLPFDIGLLALDDPLQFRLEVVGDRLERPRRVYHEGEEERYRALARQFLMDCPDEGIDVSVSRTVASTWLVKQLGHPSLWSKSEWHALSSISDAIISRRANRAELWLILSLIELSGRASTLAHWSAESRKILHDKLDAVWAAARPCKKRCVHCGLPCVLNCSHHGDHSCGADDHTCHRFVRVSQAAQVTDSPMSTVEEGETCEEACRPCKLLAGHPGPCRDRAPSLQLDADASCAICLEPLPLGATTALREGNLGPWRRKTASADCCNDREFSSTWTRRMLRRSRGFDDDPSLVVVMGGDSGGVPVTVLPCAHVFHEACVDPWMRKSSFCPLCRNPSSSPKSGGNCSTVPERIQLVPLMAEDGSMQLMATPSAASLATTASVGSTSFFFSSESEEFSPSVASRPAALPPLSSQQNLTEASAAEGLVAEGPPSQMLLQRRRQDAAATELSMGMPQDVPLSEAAGFRVPVLPLRDDTAAASVAATSAAVEELLSGRVSRRANAVTSSARREETAPSSGVLAAATTSGFRARAVPSRGTRGASATRTPKAAARRGVPKAGQSRARLPALG